MIYHLFLIGIFAIHAIVFFSLFLKNRKWFYPALTLGFAFLIAYNIHRIINLEAGVDNIWVAVRWTGIIICTISGIFMIRSQMKVWKAKMMMNPKLGALFLRIILDYVKWKDKIGRIFKKNEGDQ